MLHVARFVHADDVLYCTVHCTVRVRVRVRVRVGGLRVRALTSTRLLLL